MNQREEKPKTFQSEDLTLEKALLSKNITAIQAIIDNTTAKKEWSQVKSLLELMQLLQHADKIFYLKQLFDSLIVANQLNLAWMIVETVIADNEILKTLFCFSSIEARQKNLERFVELAAQNDHWNLVKLLLTQMQNDYDIIEMPRHIDRYGYQPEAFAKKHESLFNKLAIDAIRGKHTASLKEILSNDFKFKDKFFRDPNITWALTTHDVKIIPIIVASVAFKTSSQQEVCTYTVGENSIISIKHEIKTNCSYLHKYFKNIANQHHANKCLLQAVIDNNIEAVKFFIEVRATLDAVKTSRGQSALHIAIINKNEAMVKLLLKSSANIFLKDADGNDALDLAILSDDVRIIQLIRQAKLITDNQNTHDSSLMNSINLSITKLKSRYTLTHEQIHQALSSIRELALRLSDESSTRRILIVLEKISNFPMTLESASMSAKQLLALVYSAILDADLLQGNVDDLLKSLLNNLSDVYHTNLGTHCVTGTISRIIQTIDTCHPDVNLDYSGGNNIVIEETTSAKKKIQDDLESLPALKQEQILQTWYGDEETPGDQFKQNFVKDLQIRMQIKYGTHLRSKALLSKSEIAGIVSAIDCLHVLPIHPASKILQQLIEDKDQDEDCPYAAPAEILFDQLFKLFNQPEISPSLDTRYDALKPKVMLYQKYKRLCSFTTELPISLRESVMDSCKDSMTSCLSNINHDEEIIKLANTVDSFATLCEEFLSITREASVEKDSLKKALHQALQQHAKLSLSCSTIGTVSARLTALKSKKQDVQILLDLIERAEQTINCYNDITSRRIFSGCRAIQAQQIKELIRKAINDLTNEDKPIAQIIDEYKQNIHALKNKVQSEHESGLIAMVFKTRSHLVGLLQTFEANLESAITPPQ